MKLTHTRKPNRLHNYNYSSNGSYFLTICVKERECLLSEILVGGDVHGAPDHAHPQKPTLILSEYGQVVKKRIENGKSKLNSLTVDTYVIMPNHIHMILSLCNDGLICSEKPCHDIIPKYISSLKTLITKEIGFSLFQRNFHDRIIRNEAEYEKLWQYIELNPAIWADDTFYAS